MNSDKYLVMLYVYDITNGMAKTMSPMFLGKVIEGVWHTGLVVYEKEYFYGGGICVGVPGVNIHVIKIRRLLMELQ